MIEDYLAELKALLTTSRIVKDIEIIDEFVTSVSGFLDCKITLIYDSTLFFTEYSTSSNKMIIRWDNAPQGSFYFSPPHAQGWQGVQIRRDDIRESAQDFREED